MKSMALVPFVVSLAAVPIVNADGTLDPGFGHGGRVVTDFGVLWPQLDTAASLAVQPDGRAVAGGSTNINLEQTVMAVARYLPSGALDASFSGDGRATVFFAGMPQGFIDVFASAEAVLVQPDGRLVLVGGIWTFAGRFFALARLNPDGSPDLTFGSGGQLTTKFPPAGSPPYTGGAAAVAGLLLPDGRIVAVGVAGPDASPKIAAARYNADGLLDTTFGSQGRVLLSLAQSFLVRDAALQPDGKLVIAGIYASGDFGVVRLLPDGAPDPAFDGDGLATASFGGTEQGYSVVLLPDGRIVLAGSRYTASQWVSDFALVRFLADGTLDTSFGTGGLATADGGPWDTGEKIIRLPSGKLLVAGSSSGASDETDFMLARFEADGALDTTFGTAGFLRADFSTSVDECHEVAIAGPDLVVAGGGTGPTYQPQDFALARYILTIQGAEGASETP
jgi:uncharacterized delta-60 repeat protein